MRANQIKDQLGLLKNALSTLNRNSFFSQDDSCCTRTSDPFLSELHIKLKSVGVDEINAEIKRLEKEFSEL